MAKEKIDLSGKTEAELAQEITSMEQEYQSMKFDHAVKGLANPLELRAKRRNIARLHTELRKRALAVATPDELAMRTKIQARRRQK